MSCIVRYQLPRAVLSPRSSAIMFIRISSPSAIWTELVAYAPAVWSASLTTAGNALAGLVVGSVLGVVGSVLASLVRVIDGVLKNLPARPLAWILRVLILPTGRRIAPPSDKLGSKVAAAMMRGDDTLARLTHGM